MGPKKSYIQLSEQQRREVETLGHRPGWRRLRAEELPSFLPTGLAVKTDSMVVVASGTPSNRTILMFNADRVDVPAAAIDHEPFIVAVLPSGASTGGILVHHGDWEGRTRRPPPDFWQHVTLSGVGNYFFSNPPSGKTMGDLEELPVGQKAAFERVLELTRDEL